MNAAHTQNNCCELKQLIEAYLAEMEWNETVEIYGENMAARTCAMIGLNGHSYRLFIETDPQKHWIEVYLYSDHNISHERVSAACQLANRINRATSNGYVAALDFGEGFQYKQVMDTEGCKVSTIAIRNMVDAGFAIMDNWRSEMDLVCNSRLGLQHIDDQFGPSVH